jgi:hypothetical protein
MVPGYWEMDVLRMGGGRVAVRAVAQVLVGSRWG